jgi:hypothetical protein
MAIKVGVVVCGRWRFVASPGYKSEGYQQEREISDVDVRGVVMTVAMGEGVRQNEERNGECNGQPADGVADGTNFPQSCDVTVTAISIIRPSHSLEHEQSMDDIPSLSAGPVGSRFVSQNDIETARAKREEQWKAAYARLGQAPPAPQQEDSYDGRSLAEVRISPFTASANAY